MAKRKVSHPQETKKQDKPRQAVTTEEEVDEKASATINLTVDEFDRLGEIFAGFSDLSAMIEPGTGSQNGQRGVRVMHELLCRELDRLWSDISEREDFDGKQDAAEGGAA